jgi:carboxypeptidase family protein
LSSGRHSRSAPCPEPFDRIIRLIDTPAGTGSDQAATTDSSGSYRIDLKPGAYNVRASGPGDQAGGLGGPRKVAVAAGKTVTADFVYTIQLL